MRNEKLWRRRKKKEKKRNFTKTERSSDETLINRTKTERSADCVRQTFNYKCTKNCHYTNEALLHTGIHVSNFQMIKTSNNNYRCLHVY